MHPPLMSSDFVNLRSPVQEFDSCPKIFAPLFAY